MIFRKVGAEKKPKKVGAGAAYRDEIKKLMFGCGDQSEPDQKSLELLELYYEEAMTNLIVQASRRCQRHGGGNTVRVADILYTIRKDEKKYLRMPYIISQHNAHNQTTGAAGQKNEKSHLRQLCMAFEDEKEEQTQPVKGKKKKK